MSNNFRAFANDIAINQNKGKQNVPTFETFKKSYAKPASKQKANFE
jgi:hypothetical protein